MARIDKIAVFWSTAEVATANTGTFDDASGELTIPSLKWILKDPNDLTKKDVKVKVTGEKPPAPAPPGAPPPPAGPGAHRANQPIPFQREMKLHSHQGNNGKAVFRAA